MTQILTTFSNLGPIMEDTRGEERRKYLGPLEENAEGSRSLGPDLALAAGIGSTGGRTDEDWERWQRLE